MKVLKIIFLVIIIIVAVVLIATLFVKKEYSVEREITINKPKQQVFDYLVLLKNQNEFSKWAKMDSNAKFDFKGTDGTVGFISHWESQQKNVGTGEQEITKIDPGKRIDYELRFIKPMQSKASESISTDSISANETKVKWNINGKMPYPSNFMLLFMNMDKMVGDDLSTGLTNLKALLEK